MSHRIMKLMVGGLLHLVQRGLGRAAARPGSSSLYQTAHPSTASVPITVLLYMSVALRF